MIRLSPRPAMPAQLRTPAVAAEQAKIEHLVATTGKVSSGAFTPLWGNGLEIYELTEISIAQLDGVPTNVIDALKPLSGRAYQGKKAFADAVRALLSRDEIRTWKKKLYKAALCKTIPHILWAHHQGKCCYCEMDIHWKRESDVEHLRPKAGYWWLAYVWENYFLACKICNSDFKSDQFPLLPGGHRALRPEDILAQEQPVLLHPIDDDPEAWLSYEHSPTFVKAQGKTCGDRAHRTANELTGINHRSRMEARARLLPGLQAVVILMGTALQLGEQALIDYCVQNIRAQTAANQAFLGFRRAFFREYGLAEYLA